MYRQKIILIYMLLAAVFSTAYSSDLKIIEETPTSLSIEYSPVLDDFQEFSDDNGNITYKPIIKNTFVEETTTGSPSFLVYAANVIVPDENSFFIKNYDVVNKTTYNKKIIPTPEYDYSNLKINYKPDFNTYYEKESDEIIELKYIGIARGKHLAQLIIKVAYNNQGQIEIPEKFIINIGFDYNNNGKRSYSQESDMINAVNYNQSKYWSNSSSENSFLSGDYENISSGNWYKIEIPKEGIYRITASQLSDMGIPNNPETASTIKIFGYGGKPLSQTISDEIRNNIPEQQIIVNTNSNGEISDIIFYAAGIRGFEYNNNNAERYINYFADNNAYLITYGGRDGKRAVAQTFTNANADRKLTKYTDRILFEEEIQNPYALGGGTQWFGKSYFEAPFINKLPNLDKSGKIRYRFALAHSSPDGPAMFEILENSNQIGSVYLSSTSYEYTHSYRSIEDITVDASLIASDNRSNLKLNYKTNAIGGYSYYIDYFEIHYPRDMVAVNNELCILNNEELPGVSEFSANGFNGDIYGFDITDRQNPVLIKNTANTGGMFIFKDSTSVPGKNYFISSNLKSAIISSIDFQNLRAEDDSYDMILITHKNLLESAQKYKEYREANSNLNVGIFTTDIIYNEFSATLPDITAIRDFIAFAYHNWSNKPKFVMLWGDGHYDYRNINTSAVNYVPVYQSTPAEDKFNEVNYDFATDDYFMRIDGDDDVADIAVGRITINNNEEGNWIVDKIDHYENNSSKDAWRTNSILIADDGPTDDSSDGPTHNNQSEDLADDYIDRTYSKDKIYMVEYERQYSGGEIRKPDVTKDILSAVNNESGLFLNFIGHGNPGVWTHERVFERDSHIKLLTNLDKLSFLTAATCDYGRFDNPEVKTGSELFMSSKSGGAIGVFSATRVVLSQSNADLNNLLYKNIFRRKSDYSYPTLGEAMLAVKQLRNATNDEKFFLLADPAMKLLIPEYDIVIDSINSNAVDELTKAMNLKALSDVTISGTIKNKSTGNTLNDFNGNILLTVREGDKYFDLLEQGESAHFLFRKHGAALNKILFEVKNGKFKADFIIPKDISFSDSLGRMYLYAYSDDDRYAKGIFRNYYVNGIAETSYSDNNGPDISLFVDDRAFDEGDFVREEPLLIVDLFDETGINTTGLGIGHKIEAWIDENPVAIDLTEKFTPSLDDPRYGTTQDYLQYLKPGIHSIKVRAWDIFNNYSESITFFRIAGKDEGYFISELINYPNPFNTTTTISFKNNLTPPVDGKLIIYSPLGQIINERNFTVNSSLKGEVQWDGTFENGSNVPAGMYFYKLILNDINGNTAIKSNKLIYHGY